MQTICTHCFYLRQIIQFVINVTRSYSKVIIKLDIIDRLTGLVILNNYIGLFFIAVLFIFCVAVSPIYQTLSNLIWNLFLHCFNALRAVIETYIRTDYLYNTTIHNTITIRNANILRWLRELICNTRVPAIVSVRFLSFLSCGFSYPGLKRL